MARNTYSAGKRQRERAKQLKKKDKEARRQQNRGRGDDDNIPIATVEELQGGVMISAEEAAAQGAGLVSEPAEGEARRTGGVPVRLFVGGLNWRATEADLRALFEKLGPVNDAVIVTDRDTGDSRGFGFVTMADRRDASKAVKDLSGSEVDGRTIVVKPATERRR
ncbi:MAG: hypothetical protein JKY37_18925 [Nannocystaceae bacterium]|nr:hypothetical protein [Nannocystaceae bacterium]